MSDSLWHHGLLPARLLCPWDSPGKNIGVGSHFILRGILLTQGSNLGLPHCRQTLHIRTKHNFNWLKLFNPLKSFYKILHHEDIKTTILRMKIWPFQYYYFFCSWWFSFSCYSQIPYIGCLINNRYLFLTILKAGSLGSKCWHGHVWWELASRFIGCQPLPGGWDSKESAWNARDPG